MIEIGSRYAAAAAFVGLVVLVALAAAWVERRCIATSDAAMEIPVTWLVVLIVAGAGYQMHVPFARPITDTF